LANSNFNQGVLQLKSTDENDNPVIIKFGKENSALNLYKAGTLSGDLFESNISLDSLVFRRIATSKSEAVKIEMVLRDLRSKTNKTVSFYNTIILRGGY
jgi:hypothetical protein